MDVCHFPCYDVHRIFTKLTDSMKKPPNGGFLVSLNYLSLIV
ncbi:hypothetical protein DB29_01772 [Shouchella clausii]|nr:hypothetical protein DB29_01772 [Shouchella clausii]